MCLQTCYFCFCLLLQVSVCEDSSLSTSDTSLLTLWSQGHHDSPAHLCSCTVHISLWSIVQASLLLSSGGMYMCVAFYIYYQALRNRVLIYIQWYITFCLSVCLSVCLLGLPTAFNIELGHFGIVFLLSRLSKKTTFFSHLKIFLFTFNILNWYIIVYTIFFHGLFRDYIIF